ncbi:Protein FAR1-RELATED SEQUENCE 5 [Glycine max]|nr:Protein FAR1-RELATED SEQUENCE 5 [Glycine max]
MDKDQWMYDNTMSQEVHMDYENEEECGVNQPHVDCSDAFNTCQVFGTRDDVLQWAQTVAHENGFVVVIMRSNTDIGSRERNSFEISEKPVHGGEGWTVKLICGIHNHELAKSLVGHPYAGRLTKDEKKIIVEMTKSMVKPKNILLTLKEHNANSCTTIKQIYNARSAYRSSIRGADTEMEHLMKLLELVVRDLFWCHPDAVKLCNACHLMFFIDNTYKTNRYRLPLLEFVGVAPTRMRFLAGFAYLEGERVNNIVWALERNDRLLVVIVTDRDLALMNAVKTMFPECTNLLCRFHIDKNVKAKCKSLIGQKNAWEYVISLLSAFKGFKLIVHLDQCSLTMLRKHELSHTRKNLLQPGRIRVESAHWALKGVLQNSLGDLCSVWDAMNNMIML